MPAGREARGPRIELEKTRCYNLQYRLTEKTRLVRCLFYLLETELSWTEQVVRTLEYGPLNQPITALLVPERYDKYIMYRDNYLTNEAKE